MRWALLLCTASHAAVLRGRPLISRRTLVSFGAASLSMPYASQAVEQQSGGELAPAVQSTSLSLRATCEATAKLSSSEERLPILLFSRPLYGLETPDVAYPDWCLGRWVGCAHATSPNCTHAPLLVINLHVRTAVQAGGPYPLL